MIFLDIERHLTPAEMQRIHRRTRFAEILGQRSAAELKTLLGRPVSLIDLELTGSENDTDYYDIVKIILKQKEEVKEPKNLSADVRCRRAAARIRSILEVNASTQYLDGGMRAFLSDLLTELDGK